MLRVGERGRAEFREIEWGEALRIAGEWLGKIRATDPKQLAFFTGRDQSQALTGYWAKQFGTPNYAAHGGFCSVNMAAAGFYTIGGSFWEFGEPDWDLAEYFLLFGVAEDHDSNPIKIGLGKLKARGVTVIHILGKNSSQEHPFTSAAKMVDGKLDYSAAETPELEPHLV